MLIEVKESRKQGARTFTTHYTFGETLEEIVEQFGEDVVYNAAKDALTRDIRALVRVRLKASESDDQIHAALHGWRAFSRSSNPNVSKFGQLLAECTAEEVAAIQEQMAARVEEDNN
ncbi:MAG: hypothetical protein K9L19_18230 [Desulfarculaceae bacterium]|nr:hypothetical protein [Desulfarculaceae bacterium]